MVEETVGRRSGEVEEMVAAAVGPGGMLWEMQMGRRLT
jgi:hypothetical protein